MRLLLLTTFAVVALCQCYAARHEEKTSKKLVSILYSLVDVNDDGLISRDELERTFAKYDQDGNKGIDRSEFIKQWQLTTRSSLAESSATFTLFDVDNSGSFDAADIVVMAKLLDEDKNGEITDREFMRRFSMLLSDVPYVLMFSRGDKNTDGVMTEDEFDQTFQLFDLNGDGQVDASEFIKLWVAREYNDVATSKRLYGKLDINGDDKLDKKSDLKTLFTILDVGKNGDVSQQEFVDGWAKVSVHLNVVEVTISETKKN